jgi:hypothetical protein
MSFGCPFLDLHLTTSHFNIDIQIIGTLDLGTSTLLFEWRVVRCILKNKHQEKYVQKILDYVLKICMDQDLTVNMIGGPYVTELWLLTISYKYIWT